MTLEQAAAAYRDAKHDLAKFRENNLPTLAQLSELEQRVATLAEQVKEAGMAALGPGASASYCGVPVTRVVAKGYDLDLLLEKCPTLRNIPGLVRLTYDSKTLAGAIKAGIVPADVAEECKTVVKSDTVRLG